MDKTLLKDILKAQGLDLAEDAVALVVKGVLKSLPAIVTATENKFDDMLIPLLAVVEPQLMKLIDKIDGQEG